MTAFNRKVISAHAGLPDPALTRAFRKAERRARRALWLKWADRAALGFSVAMLVAAVIVFGGLS